VHASVTDTPKLTRDNVKTLPAIDGKRTTYADDVVRGLQLRVSPTGDRSWSFVYSHRGVDRRYTLGKVKVRDDYDQGLTLKAARDAASDVRGRVARREDPQGLRALERKTPAPAAAPSISSMATEAIGKFQVATRTRAEWLRTAEHDIFPDLGDRPVDEVTRAELRAWMRKQADRAPVQANRAFQLLRSCFNWAVAEEIVAATPFVGLKLPTKEKASERWLSTLELRCLLQALDGIPGPRSNIVLLLLFTAGRLDMAVEATREEFELDGENPRWVIPASRMKGKRDHVVPLSRQAVELVSRLPQRGVLFPHEGPQERRGGKQALHWSSHYVEDLRFELALAWAKAKGREIPTTGPAAARAVDRAAVVKMVPTWTIHNLRHTIGTHLTEDLGVSEAVVSRILSHAPEGPKVSRIYNRARRLPERRTALQAWADRLDVLREQSEVLPFQASGEAP
jgi:integrase